MSLHKRHGVTLLELMVTLPTATVLIGAMAMCITVIMRAKSQDDTLFRSNYDLSSVAHRMASDIETATAIVSSSASHIEFVVPDRDSDGLPEQMRYEWGGTVGGNANTVLWRYNHQPISVLFDDVGDFQLQTNTVSIPIAVPNHLRSETAVLKSVNAFPGGVFREQVINASNPIGQYFVPDVVGSGVKWDLGSIRLMVRAADANTDGVLCIRIMRSDTSNKIPIAPILAEINISERRLGTSYQWLDVPLAPISWQAQGVPLCITLSYAGGTGDIARVQYLENGTGMPTNANLVTSTDGGTTWTASNNSKGLRFFATGFYDGYTGQRNFLSSVNLRLGSSRLTTTRIETSARLLALPEVP